MEAIIKFDKLEIIGYNEESDLQRNKSVIVFDVFYKFIYLIVILMFWFHHFLLIVENVDLVDSESVSNHQKWGD